MAGTPNVGTLVGAAIRPINTADLISTAYANEIKGGIHGYATLAERDSIIIERRQWGMLVVVYDDNISTSNNKTYQLSYNTSSTILSDNLNWVEYTGASSTNINEWQNSVKSILTAVPPSPSDGDRYLVGLNQNSTITGAPWAGNSGGFISQYNSATTTWTNILPTNGMTVRVDDQYNSLYKYEGDYYTGEWVKEKLTQVHYVDFIGNGVLYTTTISPTFSVYDTEVIFLSKFNTSNIGSISININGIGIKMVKKPSINGLVDLTPNDIIPENIYSLSYDFGNDCFQFVKTYSNDSFNIKYYIEPNDYIVVPPYCQYWVYGDLTVDGTILNYGKVIVANGELIIGTFGVVENYGDVDLITIGGGNSNVDFSAIDGHLIPSVGDTYDIGATAGYSWRDLYLSGNTIYLGDSVISSVGGEVLFNGTPAGGATGSIGATGATGADGDKYSTTSSNTFSIPGLSFSRDFVIGTGLAYTPSQTIIVSPDINSNDHFHGTINSYYPLTGSMSVTCTDINGSVGVTYSSWTINLSGAVGVIGDIGPTGATGPTYIDLRFTHATINPVSNTGYNIGVFPQIQPYTNLTTNKGVYLSQYTGSITDVSIVSDYTGGSTESSTFTIFNITQATSSLITNTIKYTTSVLSTTTIINEPLINLILPGGWSVGTNVTFISGYVKFGDPLPTLPLMSTLDVVTINGSAYDSISVTCDIARFGAGSEGPMTIQYSLDGGLTWITAGNTANTVGTGTYVTSTVSFASGNGPSSFTSNMKIRFYATVTPGNSSKRLKNVIINGITNTALVFNNYTLASELPVNVGDYVNIRWNTPSWVTAPTSITNVLNAKLKLL